MLKFNLTLPNTDPIFFALQTPIRDFSDLWPQFVLVLQHSIGSQITGEGVGPGGHYPPLSEKYAKWKAKRFPAPVFFSGPACCSEVSSAAPALSSRRDRCR